jgi:carboxymethylenebutenolidase
MSVVPGAALLAVCSMLGDRGAAFEFESGGATVHVVSMMPEGKVTAPAVILAPGAAGLTIRERELCAYLPDLARKGFAAFLVQFLDRTGESRVNRSSITPERFALWQQTLKDAVTRVSGRPGVDPKRIALVGYSLGAYLSVAVGWEDPRVGAVVDYYGGIPGEQRPRRGGPPVLILHGDADNTVPVAEARRLDTLLSERGVPHEVKIYPGAGHVFDVDSQAQRDDALERTVAFLRQHLAPPGKP